MKILIISSPHYDFCQATLIEGLHELIKEGEDIELVVSEYSNYGQTSEWNYCIDDVSKLQEFGDVADIVVLCSNNDVKEYILKDSWHNKIIYLDGEDLYYYKKNAGYYIAYFKREFRKKIDHPINSFPFPFATENRYFTERSFNDLWRSKDIDVCCMFGPHDDTKPWRREIEERLLQMGLKNSIVGQNYGGNVPSFNKIEIDTGNRHHDNYYNTLSRSMIAVDAMGAYGCNSGRFWESLANGCCLVTQKMLIDIPHPFENDKNFVEFKDVDDMEEKIKFLLENKTKLCQIARLGFEHTLKFHTTKERAIYFLNICKGNL